MSGRSSVRLEEVEGPPPKAEKIIEARYDVVTPRPRSLLGRILAGLIALGWAAALGFAIPQAWLFFEYLGGVFAANG